MKFLGLNSPEILIISVIILSILGPKRVEKGWLLFQRLLKYLLTNEDNSSNGKPIIKVSDKKAVETEEGKTVVETSEAETNKTQGYNSNNVLVEITEEGEAKSEETKLNDHTDGGKESKNKAGEETLSKSIEENTEVIAKAEEEKIIANKKVITKGRSKVKKTKKKLT